MSDQGFHEINLSGKQLFFLFMAAVVLGVVVFLLGVSVGQGVREAAPQTASTNADASVPGDTTVPAEVPPTKTSPADLTYHEKLLGTADPTKAEPPVPPPDAPPAGGAGTGSDAGTTAAPPASTLAQTQPAPAEPKAGAADRRAAAPAPGGGKPAAQTPAEDPWFVQVDAFRSKDLANKQINLLKSQGYPALLVTVTEGVPYKVRVGPFATRAEAVTTAAKLEKEGHRPSVTR
jgi:cell division protein FtsN